MVEYQGIGIRFVAQVIDGVIFSVIFWIAGLGFASIYGGLTPTGFHLTGSPALQLLVILLIIWLAYFTILEGLYGQTVGKKICKIKVIKENGEPCDLHASFIRNILRIVDGIGIYLVGAILILRSNKKQRLGDRLARTVIVKK